MIGWFISKQVIEKIAAAWHFDTTGAGCLDEIIFPIFTTFYLFVLLRPTTSDFSLSVISERHRMLRKFSVPSYITSFMTAFLEVAFLRQFTWYKHHTRNSMNIKSTFLLSDSDDKYEILELRSGEDRIPLATLFHRSRHDLKPVLVTISSNCVYLSYDQHIRIAHRSFHTVYTGTATTSDERFCYPQDALLLH